jgi:hypothetical protein
MLLLVRTHGSEKVSDTQSAWRTSCPGERYPVSGGKVDAAQFYAPFGQADVGWGGPRFDGCRGEPHFAARDPNGTNACTAKRLSPQQVDREPELRICPRVLDGESAVAGDGFDHRHGEFVAVLGMNGLAFLELN